MDGKKKILPVFKSTISGSLVGSLVLHCAFLVVYGLVLIPDLSNSPKSPKKFKIEMVKRKASVPQKVQFKKTSIKKPGGITPVKMSRPKAVSIKQTFQPKKINKTKISSISRPRQTKQVNINQRTSQKYKVGKIKKVNLTEQRLLPKPKNNIPIVRNPSGKKIKMYQNPVHATPIFSKPKPIMASSVIEKGVRLAKTLHEASNAVNVNLSKVEPRTMTTRLSKGVPKRRVSYQEKGRLSYKQMSSLRAMKSGVETKVLSGKAMGIYESKARSVTNIPSTPLSKFISPIQTNGADAMRASLVQKGTLPAMMAWPDPRPVPTIVDKRVLAKYLNALQGIIASSKKYPEAARKSGMEGKATIQFIVMKNGEVKDIQFISKTNYPILNKEAINAIKRAAPFSRIPDEIGKTYLEIVLPFRFKLNE